MESAEQSTTEAENGVIELETNNRKRIVSMTDPFKAFQVISQHANIDYVSKLGKLLTNTADIMKS